MPRSVLRHRPIGSGIPPVSPAVQRASRTQRMTAAEALTIPEWVRAPSRVAPTPHPSRHWRTQVGFGMLCAMLLVLVAQIVAPWLVVTWNDWHYGRPRTFQFDAFVGHESGHVPSHFIALNLAGQIEVIELPGGESALACIYDGPHLLGPGSDLEPVTLRVVSGALPRHPDLLIEVQGTQLLLRNTGSHFLGMDA